MISLALGPAFMTFGALDAGRDCGFAMIFNVFDALMNFCAFALIPDGFCNAF